MTPAHPRPPRRRFLRHTSGLLLDDGVIDPRDTRAVLAFCLDTIADGAARDVRTMQFGVARM